MGRSTECDGGRARMDARRYSRFPMTQLDIVERKHRDSRGRRRPRLLAPLALLLLLDAAPAWTAPLLQKPDLQYAGVFRVPADQSAQQSFGYGAMGMAYNPSRNSLYMVGHLWYQQTAEVSIP